MLVVRGLKTSFPSDAGTVRAVDGVSFSLAPGETLGIVGESGSGKSVTNLSILRLVDSPPAVIEAEEISFKGRDLRDLSEGEMHRIRGREIAMIFQDPMTSLNPYMKIHKQLGEVLVLHTDLGRRERKARVLEMLKKVGISDAVERAQQYPHELSGGMRQRVMIAMALLCNPSLLIADEPTTALDVTIQAQILDLIREMVAEMETALILVSHDLGVVAGMADRVMVMYAGKMMEVGPTAQIFKAPKHPYTRGLLKSMPRLSGQAGARLYSIPGMPPNPAKLPVGCPFSPRCAHRVDVCDESLPEAREIAQGHSIRCHVDLPEDAS